MKRNSLRRKSNCRRGAYTVEFALVAPLLFVTFFASIEFSRMNMIRNTAENAAYEGARRALIVGGDSAAAQSEAESVLAMVGVTNATVEVTPEIILSTTPQVTVDISVPMDSNGYGISKFFRGETLDVTITLDREWSGDE